MWKQLGLLLFVFLTFCDASHAFPGEYRISHVPPKVVVPVYSSSAFTIKKVIGQTHKNE